MLQIGHSGRVDRLHQYVVRPPRLWQKVALVLLAVSASSGLAIKRGWAVGAAAALVYGALAITSILSWERLKAWSSEHPVLDSALFGPLLFLALAYITSLPTATCILIALVAAAAFAGLTILLRARKA